MIIKSQPRTDGTWLLAVAYIVVTVMIFGFVWVMFRRGGGGPWQTGAARNFHSPFLRGILFSPVLRPDLSLPWI